MKKKQYDHLNRFEEGILWNYLATAMLAISGFMCNLIIAFFYDATAVGLFNRIYSYYLVISQISVFGIHMSLGHSIPKLYDREKQANSLGAAILLTLFVSTSVSFMLWIGTGVFEKWMTVATQKALKNILIALILFSVNKIFLAFLNGNSCMKEYAILQFIRYLFLGGSVWVLSILSVKPEQLVLCFFFSEFFVFIAGVCFLVHMNIYKFHIHMEYIKEHLIYGKKIFLSNLVLDLNTKVDVISLGVLLQNDYFIGIYSFAVMFIEGFYQMLVVIRRSINPKITKVYYEMGDELQDLIRAKKIVDIISLIVYIGIVVCYYIICLLTRKEEYLGGVAVILIIGMSIVMTRKYILFGNVFSQIGKPEYETRVNIGTVLINIVANFLLIPIWGINGAAIATAMSYIAFAIFLNYFRKKYSFELRHFFNSL